MLFHEIILAIGAERRRQDELVRAGKLPWNCHDPQICGAEKCRVIGEEYGEVCKASCELDHIAPPDAVAEYRDLLRTELIQLAAVCVAWLESIPSK